MKIISLISTLHKALLSTTTKSKGERVILFVAIASYLIHLFIIFLVNQGVLTFDSNFTSNPIAAIYTPFSFILIYEVYLLIYYLPKSITSYIGKQYEIITLIIIRRIFKDIANIEFSTNWFEINDDVQFTIDIGASVLLFYLIYLFYQQVKKRQNLSIGLKPLEQMKIQQFITLKKTIAIVLVPVLVLMASYSFYSWLSDVLLHYGGETMDLKDANTIFFDEFFSILIIVDVLLLLSSFFYSDQFHKVMRNSGFVISTILIKISFSADGVLNVLLIVGAVVFGLLILLVHDQYEKNPTPTAEELTQEKP
jgi:hypothetical protein